MAELKSCEQCGEDHLVWEYFGCATRGYFAEIGANDPEIGSKTYLLEENGWRGVLVEPNPAFFERLRLRRPNSRVVRAACGSPAQRGKAALNNSPGENRTLLAMRGDPASVPISSPVEVRVMTLDEILAASDCPELDFLSLNVDGAELDVLKGLDLKRHRPKLILVADRLLSLAVHRRLRANGYKAVKRTGGNNWYIPAAAKFVFSSTGERMKLFRKISLGTPFRGIKNRLRGRNL